MRLAIAFLAACTIACAKPVGPAPGPETPSPEAKTPTTPAHPRELAAPGQYVVVWNDAKLHHAAEPASAHVVAAQLSERRPGDVSAFRLIAKHGSWYEVETLRDPAAHCHSPIALFRNVEMRFFVSASDVVPVTTAAMKLDFPDGSRIHIPSGVHATRPKSPGDDARYLLGAGDFSIPVALPSSDIGLVYAKDSSIPMSPSSMPDLARGPRVGGEALIDQRREHSKSSEARYCSALVPTYAHEAQPPAAVPSQLTVEVSGPQARIAFHYKDGKRRYVPCTGCCAPECQGNGMGRHVPIPEPAPTLYWPGGQEAGPLRRAFEVEHLVPGAQADRVCFSPTAADSSALRLCADRQSIEVGDGRSTFGPFTKVTRLEQSTAQSLLEAAGAPFERCVPDDGVLHFSIGPMGVLQGIRTVAKVPPCADLINVLTTVKWPRGRATTNISVRKRPRY